MPPGILPPQIINFSASTVPILQLGLSGNGLSEQQLNDYGANFIRPQLVTVPGAVLPNAYGGKQRSDHGQPRPQGAAGQRAFTI